MSMRHRSSNPHPHPAVLPHLRCFGTPDMTQFGGWLKKALGTSQDTAADRGIHLTHRTEDLAWRECRWGRRRRVDLQHTLLHHPSCFYLLQSSFSALVLCWMWIIKGKTAQRIDDEQLISLLYSHIHTVFFFFINHVTLACWLLHLSQLPLTSSLAANTLIIKIPHWNVFRVASRLILIFFFFFFFVFPSYISGVHHFWVRFLRMWPFF